MLKSRDWDFWFEQQIRRSGVVGSFIKTCREHYRLTQAKVASELGIKQGTFSQLESGNYLPTKNMKIRLAELFQCSESLFEDM